MADVRVSQLPQTGITSGNTVVATTGTTTIRVVANSLNSTNTVVVRDGSGNSGFNTLTCNTLNGGNATFSNTVQAAFFKGDGSQLTNLPVADGVPVGTIILYGGFNPPGGYINCDGRALDRTLFYDLYSIVGTYYGSGNGSTTFNVPDLRGRVPIGTGMGPGLTFRAIGQRLGAENHLLTANESGLREHTHRENMGGQRHQNKDNGHGMSGPSVQSGLNTRGVNGGAQDALVAHNNMQPSLGVSYFIKFA